MEKRILLAIVLLALLLAQACTDDLNEGNQPERQGWSVSYTVTTSQYARAQKPEEQQLLTPSERAMATPKISKAEVSLHLDAAGGVSGTVQMLPNGVAYPSNAIGNSQPPEYLKVNRISFDAHTVSYYNGAGSLIEASPLDARLASYYQMLASEIQAQVTLSAEEFGILMEAWSNASFSIEAYGDKLHLVRIPAADGGETRLIIDNALQAIVGNAEFDANGKLISKSYMQVEGTMQEPQRATHGFIVPMEAPFSGHEMEAISLSNVENIVQTLKP
jgi:hypothetical protein